MQIPQHEEIYDAVGSLSRVELRLKALSALLRGANVTAVYAHPIDRSDPAIRAESCTLANVLKNTPGTVEHYRDSIIELVDGIEETLMGGTTSNHLAEYVRTHGPSLERKRRGEKYTTTT